MKGRWVLSLVLMLLLAGCGGQGHEPLWSSSSLTPSTEQADELLSQIEVMKADDGLRLLFRFEPQTIESTDLLDVRASNHDAGATVSVNIWRTVGLGFAPAREIVIDDPFAKGLQVEKHGHNGPIIFQLFVAKNSFAEVLSAEKGLVEVAVYDCSISNCPLPPEGQ